MAVDLHSHSTASDGSEKPAALIEQALQIGLTTLALTDHDTQDGIADAKLAADGTGLELIAGTELSLEYDVGGMHLVVLWLEPGPGPLQDRLLELRHGRDQRNEMMAQRLTELGMPVTAEEILHEGGSGSIGRPHIAAVMMRKGYVETIDEAFELWLTSGKPAYIGRPRLSPEEAIQLARASGSVPVLAHPHTLGINRAHEMADLLTRLIAAGLVGLEAYCAGYRRHEREGYADLARRFGLVPAGGSDFHGTYKPGLSLGTGYGDLIVPDVVVEELRPHAGAA
ncbi:MAG TPA: PHP domain-containing protein [Acidimicrobiia bacterium]|nr:PHP domain-containing protein [Acidimicrobiia bacterium]